jgi:hypothetical protein
MKPKRKLLDTEQFESLSKIQGWKAFEIPRNQWESIIGLHRLNETIAVMGSADFNDLKLLNRINAIAGFDQLVV